MRTSRYLLRAFAIAGGLAAAVAMAPAASADPSATRVFTLTPSTHGNPEGVAAAGGGVFFVGATGDGTIYRGSLFDANVTEFIPGATGKSAVGMKVAFGRLFVAGGGTSDITGSDFFSRPPVAHVSTAAG